LSTFVPITNLLINQASSAVTYGVGVSVGWQSPEFDQLITKYYDGQTPLGARQIVKLNIDLVQTSCGYGVPLFAYEGERASLENWHDHKGPDGILKSWRDHNLSSIDGLPTGLKLEKD